MEFYQELLPICKLCGSENVVRYGTSKGVQRWWCKNCQHKFVNNNAPSGMRTDKDQIALALSEYYNGSSINAIRKRLQQQFNLFFSESTIYTWITHFSKLAIDEANNTRVNVGDTWVADETVVKIGGEEYWLMDIIDIHTRFILARTLSHDRNKDDMKALLELARDRTGKMPKQILKDGWGGHADSIRLLYGSDSQYTQTVSFYKDNNLKLIELWQMILKDRLKIMRGLKKKETAYLILDGWLVHYNFFTPQESLGYKTPAQKADAMFCYGSWMDIVCKPSVRQIAINEPELILSKLQLRPYETSLSDTMEIG